MHIFASCHLFQCKFVPFNVVLLCSWNKLTSRLLHNCQGENKYVFVTYLLELFMEHLPIGWLSASVALVMPPIMTRDDTCWERQHFPIVEHARKALWKVKQYSLAFPVYLLGYFFSWWYHRLYIWKVREPNISWKYRNFSFWKNKESASRF